MVAITVLMSFIISISLYIVRNRVYILREHLDNVSERLQRAREETLARSFIFSFSFKEKRHRERKRKRNTRTPKKIHGALVILLQNATVYIYRICLRSDPEGSKIGSGCSYTCSLCCSSAVAVAAVFCDVLSVGSRQHGFFITAFAHTTVIYIHTRIYCIYRREQKQKLRLLRKKEYRGRESGKREDI